MDTIKLQRENLIGSDHLGDVVVRMNGRIIFTWSWKKYGVEWGLDKCGPVADWVL